MSAIDSLIERLCPHGVRYLNLFEVSSYVRGVTYSKDDEDEQGEFIVLRANNINVHSNCIDLSGLKRIKSSVRVRAEQTIVSGDILMCAASGSKAHVGKVAFFTETPGNNLLFGGFMAVIRANGKINSRFLFHLLIGKTFSNYLERSLNSTTINNISASLLESFKVPVPPLEVQHEIVRILDNFTELEAELEAEQVARKKQYEHYRKSLLSFPEYREVRWVPMGEVVVNLDSKRKPVTKSSREPGPYPYFGANGIQDYVSEYIFDETLLLIGEDGSVIRPDGTPYVHWSEGKVWVNNHAHVLTANDSLVDLRFLYHFLQTVQISEFVTGGSQLKINQGNLNKILVPLPEKQIQKDIACRLDAMHEIATGMISGLPAEIKARRKQYEYYRDRLLKFKELAV